MINLRRHARIGGPIQKKKKQNKTTLEKKTNRIRCFSFEIRDTLCVVWRGIIIKVAREGNPSKLTRTARRKDPAGGMQISSNCHITFVEY